MEERRVEELFERLETSELDEQDLTAIARAATAQPRVVQAGRRARPLPLRLAGAVGAALVAAVAVGVVIGASLAPSGSAASVPTGVGFLAEAGWTVHQSGSKATPERPTVAIAANAPVHPHDTASEGFAGFPYSTLGTLPRRGVVIVASFTLREAEPQADVAFPTRKLPLRLSDATPYYELALRPGRKLAQYRIRAGVNGHHVDIYVYFGTARPSPATIQAAERQLGRLIVVGPGGSSRIDSQAQPRLPSASGAETAGLAKVIDRTVVCSTGVSAGIRVLEVGARTGVREAGNPSHWLQPAHAWVYNRKGVRYGVAGVAAPNASPGHTAPPWPTLPDPGIGHLRTTTWLDAVRCKPTVARIPLSSSGLTGGPADPFDDEFECAAPRRILVRARVVFRRSTSLRLNGRFGFHTTGEDVVEGSLAVRTEGGKPLAYADVVANGKARVFAAKDCSFQ
jgi:hypothetical protein